MRRLALIEDGTELDPATMTLLGAGEDVDVVHVPFDKALHMLRADGAECAVLPVSDGGAEAFALLEQAGGDERLRELPIVVYAAEPLGRGRARAPG